MNKTGIIHPHARSPYTLFFLTKFLFIFRWYKTNFHCAVSLQDLDFKVSGSLLSSMVHYCCLFSALELNLIDLTGQLLLKIDFNFLWTYYCLHPTVVEAVIFGETEVWFVCKILGRFVVSLASLISFVYDQGDNEDNCYYDNHNAKFFEENSGNT